MRHGASWNASAPTKRFTARALPDASVTSLVGLSWSGRRSSACAATTRRGRKTASSSTQWTHFRATCERPSNISCHTATQTKCSHLVCYANRNGLMNRAQCPCCGYYTLDSRGSFDICQVCWWEDDDKSDMYGQPAPERPTGANRVQLWE